MSFIIKRERIFNSSDLYDLPARNEGKLKAFASCTDTRAWSHFVADQSEHLMEIIKRNNEMCRPKYIPTDVIVSTLMGAKNHEIVRLKRKIGEFEQMLSIYDQLDLTMEQKKEIAVAHNAIRAANKDLDDLSLDLDLTGFTGGETESFRTGKSAGDASERSRDYETHKIEPLEFPEYVDKNFLEMISGPLEKKHRTVVTCEMSTNITDPRLDELSDTIIVKDATLNAMHNTIAAMESDAYEPYCLYAHIYTALEKIFAVLCQNEEYKRYLHLLSTSQEEMGIDIKGKILLKLKVLEKFAIALISPCYQKSRNTSTSCPSNPSPKEIEAYSVMLSELPDSKLDAKRHDLIFDIMHTDYVKSVYDKTSEKQGNLQEYFSDENLDIETNNLNRLKNLQNNYDELMLANEKLKDECNRLQNKCANYDVLESEVEKLKGFLKEYNDVVDEKEHFKKRSNDLDQLKEQFYVLAKESEALENQLILESEMNAINSSKIMEVTSLNSNLEQKISNITVSFDKDKNALECKLKEAECKILCQEQQIKSMSEQIDRLLKKEEMPESPDQIFLLNEIKRLNDVVHTREKTVRELEMNLKQKEDYMDNIKSEIESIKGNELNQSHIDKMQNEINKLMEANHNLVKECEDKTKAVNNLMGIINNKSIENNQLLEKNEQQKIANVSLKQRLKSIQKDFNIKVSELEIEKQETLSFLELAKQESDHLLNECQVIKQSSSTMIDDLEELKRRLKIITNENEKLQNSLDKCRVKEYSLEKEIEELNFEKMAYATELDMEKQYLKTLKHELDRSLGEQNDITNDLKILHDKHSDLIIKNKELINDLHEENLSRRQSEELLQRTKEQDQQEKEVLRKELLNKDLELKYLVNSFNSLKNDHENLLSSMSLLQHEYDELRLNYDKKITESFSIEANVSNTSSTSSFKKYSEEIRDKINEYQELQEQLDTLQAENDRLNKRINLLAKEFEVKSDDYNRLKNELEIMEENNKELTFKNDTLENTLINTKNELTSNSSLYRLIDEVETMKKEKLMKQLKVEKNDETIENLTATIANRDKKIALLENHINDLKEELQALKESFSSLCETSQQIKEISLQNINKSLINVESKQTQYTADIMEELNELKKANEMLERQTANMKNEAIDSIKQNERLHAQLKQLEQDKKLILENLRQLQSDNVGSTALKSNNINNEDILQTISHIRKSIVANSSKTSLLENKLLSVQTSSQILQSKADEARKLAEKERNKTLIEKEEAIKDKLNLENQMKELKETLKRQITEDEDIIEELKAELKNQQLIMDEIRKLNDQTISKLNDDLTEIQSLYNNALKKIEDLQAERQSSNEENNLVLNKINSELKAKNDEVKNLQKELSLLRAQISENTKYTDQKGTQTDEVFITESSIIDSYEISQPLINDTNLPYRKEVQVLTATIETDNKLINGKYDSEKLKDLTRGPMNLVSFNNDIVEQSTLSSENNNTASSTTDNKVNEMSKDLQKEIQIIRDNQTDFDNSNSESHKKDYSNETTESHPDEQTDNLNSDIDNTFESYKNENIPRKPPKDKTNKLAQLPPPKPLNATHSDTQMSNYYQKVKNILTDDVFLNLSTPSTEDTNPSERKNKYDPNYGYANNIVDDHFGIINNDIDISNFKNIGIYAKLDQSIEEYEQKIQILSDELLIMEMDYKDKLNDIKSQYDKKNEDLINEYRKSIQNLKNLHEIEIDDLTRTNIEAAKRAENCEKENIILKNKLRELTEDEKEPVKLSSRCCSRKKGRTSTDLQKLTKTNIQALDVQAKSHNDSCTCTPDFDVNDTLRNMFEQVNDSQRVYDSDNDYMKHVVDKIIKGNINALNTRELCFLHLNVCRVWKGKICENEQKSRFSYLDSDFDYQQLLNFDRLMEEENRVLNVARADLELSQRNQQELMDDSKIAYCPPNTLSNQSSLVEVVKPATRPRRRRVEHHNRAMLVKLEPDEFRSHDDPPTKLKKKVGRK